MELMLTSFGLSHLTMRERSDTDFFYGMPPASISSTGQEFLPDYAALLIADKIVLDRKTYDLLISGKHISYGNVALMAKALYEEGFVRLEDFETEINQNRDFLNRMLERDLRELDSWVNPLKESIVEWKRFIAGFSKTFQQDYINGRCKDQHLVKEERGFHENIRFVMSSWLHQVKHSSFFAHERLERALISSRERRKSENRKVLRDILSEYLSYVNANLFLSNKFGVGFYDWNDFSPFYKDKFMRVAQDSYPAQRQTESVRKLFDISFPELTFWSPSNIIKAFKDKRISDLRELIDQAASGQVEFDKEFANRTLSEVLRIERSIGKIRRFVSYVTMPLGLIPIAGTPIQKTTEEVIAIPIENQKRKQYRWFYLISELADKTQLVRHKDKG